MRILNFRFKDANSVGGACPAVYEVEDGWVIQGEKLAAGERAQLRDVGANEGAVWVPKNIIDQIRKMD